MTPALQTPASSGELGTFGDVLASPQWRIVTAERLSYGSLIGAATIEITGFVRLEIQIFAPAGKPAFARARAVGDQHLRTFQLEASFADAICAAVLNRLGNAGRTEPAVIAPLPMKSDRELLKLIKLARRGTGRPLRLLREAR